MRRLHPDPAADVDPYEEYAVGDVAAHLRVNMVLSADGRATDREGRSGGLGGEGDKEVFRALRAQADAILVGAGTVRTEGYGPHRMRADLRERRILDGRPLPAPIVVVSRSLDLPFDGPLFTEAETPTIVLSCQAAPAEGRQAAARAGILLIAGEDDIDLALGVSTLGERFGLCHLLCEGGPTLNGPLFAAGLVDELCLTLSPLLVGDAGPSLVGDLPEGRALTLRHVLEHDGELYLRYGMTRPG